MELLFLRCIIIHYTLVYPKPYAKTNLRYGYKRGVCIFLLQLKAFKIIIN